MKLYNEEQLNMSEQDNEEQQNQKKKGKHSWLLVLLILFIVFFVISSAILGSRLYQVASRDRYIVDMGMVEMENEIELFRIEYSNDLNEITVQGTNGEAVVAPGTTVTYDIRLRNNDEVTIDFMMTPTVEFLTDEEVPVHFKIMDDYGNYILGSEDTWVTPDEMNNLYHKGSIRPGEVFTYHVAWEWIFEVSGEQDAYDTYLGNQDGLVLPGVRVSIATEAMAGAVPTVSGAHMVHFVGKGFGCCWCCYLIWLLVLVCAIFILWIWRLRKKLSKYEDVIEEYDMIMQAREMELEQ